MEKHMDAMQTGMHKMNMNMGMSHQSGDKGQNMNMENCMGMMREHKSMIQGMMDQMKEHQAQEKKLRKHIHKK
jgi:protein CpxP